MIVKPAAKWYIYTMELLNTDLELWKFHDIFFDEESHKYTDSRGTDYTSVTTFVHEFSEPQDWDRIAARYAVKHNMTVEAVRAMWDEAGKLACAVGTDVHAFMENQWKRKRYVPTVKQPGYDELEATGRQAYNELSQRFVPIREEFIVYNQKWGICGTIDFLAYDTLKDRIVILDYKTNKEIKKDNPFQRCIGILEGLPDCNFIHYSAQLSTYKAILEEGTNLKIGGLALIHIRKDGYSVIPCADYSAQIKEYLDGRAKTRQGK